MPNNSNRTFRPIGFYPNQDCKDLFNALIEEADDGQLVGAIVISMYRRPRPSDRRRAKQYAVALCGWAAENYTLSVGAMDCCKLLIQQAALDREELA